MTRINLIRPRELTNLHLVAEYRELPRVFGLIDKWIERGCPADGIPPTYTMGKGHVKFFYPRATFLALRFELLVAQMTLRDMKPQYLHQWHRIEAIDGRGQIDENWAPTEAEVEVSRRRILERLSS